MTSSLPSAEVAADFRDALQDLKINSRPEISNLTVIAKENTEHAQAISRELEQHITSTKTRSEWKLPALYVLDSIVKNVGTPYTVYLGRNLRSIFFTAYQVADPPMRKAMDALFNTWQRPVPESLDPRPVFEPEVTRPIAEALKQYRERLAQHSYSAQPPPHLQRPPIMQPQQWRNTPTPPQAGYGLPPQAAPQFNQPHANTTVLPSPLGQYGTPVQNGMPFDQASQPQWQPPGPIPPNVDQVKADLNKLIFSTTMEMTKNPGNAQQTSGLLTTLVSLQNILQAGNLDPHSLQQVAAQVNRISGMVPQPSMAAPGLPPQHTPQPGQQAQTPQQTPQLAALAAMLQQPSTPSVSTPTLQPAPIATPPVTSTPPALAPSAAQLSSLLASLHPKPTPPPQPLSLPPPQPPAAQQPDIFASLRAAGLIPGSALPAATPAPDPTMRTRSPVNLLQTLASPPLRMETSSLKVPRPHLVPRLYEAKPDQCRQCGKRFPATEPGKKAKNAHMDWHFSVNTRIAEASKNVINRSWYISERDWISYREVDPSSPNGASNGGGGPGGGASGGGDSANPSPSKKQRTEHVVPVPTDVSEVNKVCPICQEKFEVSWHDEMQTPVWSNAVRVGKKVYHKTCYDEVAASTRGAGKGRDSPSVLGKRKLEGRA